MILCDTHTAVWWLAGAARLPRGALHAISTATVIGFSAASLWEVAIKVGKYGPGIDPELTLLLTEFERAGMPAGFELIPITPADCFSVARLPAYHRDPFDRMIIAQALERDLTIVSNDRAFDAYHVKRIW